MAASSRDPNAVEAVLPVRAKLGESPVWCWRTSRLFWVDIDGRTIHRTDPERSQDEVRTLDIRPGSIGLRSDPDRLVVAGEHSLYDFDWSTSTLTEMVRIDDGISPTRMNDGRCDIAGRFWVGSMDDPAASDARAGKLYCVDRDLTVRTVERDVAVSNSLAFDLDGTSMYWSDTRTGIVWAFDYDHETGTRSNRRPLVEFGSEIRGLPDGACVDEAGCVWIACVYGWSVIRVTPNGVVDRMVELPVEKPSMPAFGGTGLDLLYITSINSGGARPAAPGQPLAGALLVVQVGERGVPEPTFAG